MTSGQTSSAALTIWDTVQARLKAIGVLRDAAIVAGACLYALGYVVWAVYAFRHGLGQLPAIEFQYLSAGVVPAMSALLLVSTVRALLWLHTRIPVWLAPEITGWPRAARGVIFGLFHLSVPVLVVMNAGSAEPNQPLRERLGKMAAVGMLTTMVLLPPVSARKSEETRAFGNSGHPLLLRIVHALSDFLVSGGILGPLLVKFYVFLARAYVLLLVSVMVLAGLAFFIENIYPNIPQELGGAQPRCGVLDLVAADLAIETRRSLVPQTPSNGAASVVRSTELYVFFMTSDFLLVRSRKNLDDRELTYQVARSAVRSIAWCP